MTYLFVLSQHANAMFLSCVLIFHLIASTVGNPFHKYPFVFLLDVGNEEIQKTAEEQIRITVPGGSLALRYPGASGGNIIAHVRVSGIDFGTDLKADIVEGGPGNNYVVLLFKGNPGVAYDAVVTVQTIPSEITDYINQKAKTMSDGYSETNIVPDESIHTSNENIETNNAEDENGNSLGANNNQNGELRQSSSNVYNYANNQDSNGDESVEDGKEDDIENRRSEDDANPNAETNSEEFSTSEEDSIETENEDDNNIQEDNADSPRADPYSYVVRNGFIEDGSYDGEALGNLSADVYRRYNAITSKSGQNFQETIDDPQELRNSNDVELLDEDPADFDQTFNDEEIHNDGNDKELNNKYSNFDGVSPVES